MKSERKIAVVINQMIIVYKLKDKRLIFHNLHK